ncbi:unnamed protein product, partial [Soboliphyme baturini]|uniref:ZP domain-containing protein n=1 Tax=Soboliphyme baturini TaxID=241478 RepID=A0A183IC15_9BILA
SACAIPPAVQCTPFGINFDFITQLPFDGHVYVRGHYRDLQCHRDCLQVKNTTNSFQIPFDRCGLRKHRKMNPKGIVTSSTFVISFHRIFVTSVDRAFYVECFYAEEDQIALPVADLDTKSQMPMCSYHVVTSTPNGTVEVTFASIGDEVAHKWKCEHEKSVDMYCMVVHSCSVDDGNDASFEIVDKDGCSKDRYLLDELTYFDDLTAAVRSNVFKFADKAHVHFSCQVRLSLKKEYEDNTCPVNLCINFIIIVVLFQSAVG